MTEPSQNHWTDDEELLEQYLLGRLRADRKRALDTHLKTCEQCRSVVSSQEELISGIRRFGRDEVKSRLSARVAEYRQRRKNSYRYAGIAAGILLFFTVGVRDDWFFGLDRHRGDWREQADSLRQIHHSDPRGKLPATDDHSGNTPKNEMKEDANRAAPSANGAGIDGGRLPSDKTKSSGDAPAVAGAPGQLAGLPPTGAEPYDTVFFWLKGAFVGGPLEKASTHSPEAKAHMKELARITEPTRTQGIRPDPDQLTLVQRPLSEFPLHGDPMLNPPHTVPAQLKIVGPRTQLTFFLDPLFTQSEVLAATVEIVRPDSVVVSVGGRRIGCIVPPGAIKAVPKHTP